jgi:hypothetical protein
MKNDVDFNFQSYAQKRSLLSDRLGAIFTGAGISRVK